MNKKLFFVCVALLSWIGTWAATTFPQVSTEGNEKWYLIRFANNKSLLTAKADGQKVQNAQLSKDIGAKYFWKIEGSQESGYTITNQEGQLLYTSSTQKQGMFYAKQNATSNQTFKIVPTTNSQHSGYFEIQPFSNGAVSMNQWGGVSDGAELGLWDKGDVNNPLEFIAQEDVAASRAQLRIIPYPVSVAYTDCGTLAISSLTAITYAADSVKSLCEGFALQLQKTSGKALAVEVSPTAKPNAISLVVDSSIAPEGYTLKSCTNGVEISASSYGGFFYGIQTLKQMLPDAFFGQVEAPLARCEIPSVLINDFPKLGHRGFMVDESRHFFGKQEIKKLLDVAALYKLNRFHWHLTDDQGWRVQIPEYPKLTEVGSIRSGSFSNAGENPKFFDDTEYGRGMWYTLDDLREVVAYAKERNIEIIPEIDLPGHMVAAVASYPELSCDPTKTYSVRIDGGISKDVLNVGKDEVIVFLKTVLNHISEVFPYKQIHIGGDECPTDQWATNAEALARVQAQGLAGVNELQSWLVEELGTYLGEHYGKELVVWDELLGHWKATNRVKPVIMAWNHINHTASAANKGFKSIACPYQSVYLDMMQITQDKADVNELYQGGWGPNFVNSLPTVYNFNPLASLSGREEFLLGVQGNMWTETTNNATELEYQLFPRLIALAEVGWKPANEKDWFGFYFRLQQHDEILDKLNIIYAKHYIEPAPKTASEEALAEAQSILNQSIAGGVGYPSVEVYNALKTATDALVADAQNATLLSELQAKITAYKTADIVQPQAGKTYQILSASTFYKRKYAGSSMYEKNGRIRFHYTKQNEPEELWQFEATTDGWILKNLCSGKTLSMPNYNAAAVLSDANTVVRIDKATIPAGKYTYIPGAVTISAVQGYSQAVTGAVKRLYGKPTGEVHAYDDAMLCHPATWRIVEVTDYTEQLQSLQNKCKLIISNHKPGIAGQPTTDAINFLGNQLVTPVEDELKGSAVSEEVYKQYMNVYGQFLTMPRISPADALREDVYYRIRNAHFTNQFATAGSTSLVPSTVSNTDASLFRFVKNGDGTVQIISKANGGATTIAHSTATTPITFGTPHNWALQEQTSDEGNTGFTILDETGTFSWYTNPNSFRTILLQPRNWGAGIWKFEPTAETVSIRSSKAEAPDNATVYDLSGVQQKSPTRGVFVTSDGRKIMK